MYLGVRLNNSGAKRVFESPIAIEFVSTINLQIRSDQTVALDASRF